jgi:fatty acid-binding protein DegV
MAHRIALVTDSTCDIPADWIAQYEISVVALTIIFGSQAYLEGIELSAAEFYQRLSEGNDHPTTSQPSPEAF